MTASRRVARVLIDSPLPQLDRLFDYAIPEELAEAVRPGVRIRVPLRSAGRMLDAYVVELGEPDATDRPLSEVDAVVSTVPVLTPRLYALARRAADRAAGSATDILRLAIPKRMVRAEKAWLAGDPPGEPVVSEENRQWAAAVLGPYPALVECLDHRGRGALDARPEPVRLPGGATTGSWAVLLAAAAVRTLAAGRSAILVVPDHRDQAQLETALAARAPADAILRNDARQSSPARYAAFLRMLAPVPSIVVGNRSSVYAPAHAPGLIAIWDDGDPLLAEPLSPGVHARDAALLRQELDECSVVFAGHTRTTDVERLVSLGWVRDVSAARRASPRVVLSATKEGESPGARVPSAAFAAAREALRTGPVLVQVSRPGYAPVLVCADCRTPARCPACGGPLHAARRGAVPGCGWCGRQATAWACPRCESVRIRMASSGSERTADDLGRAFPDTRIILADGEHPVLSVEGRPALVVATRGAEPVAEGGYRAVILLDGDRMLLADDLRIGESCLRWWSNAAALAAPGAPVHLVGVTGAIARALATWTQPAYARAELADRAPLRMPPTVRVAALEGSAAAVDAALGALRTAVPSLEDEAILGPVPTEAGARALVRFEYALGGRVTESLRSSIVADALRVRKNPKTRAPGTRNTLRVRVDVPDLDL
ncbi:MULTISPECIES: primosomal protein N' [unclassified Microbacterium]|uniref:primosomal protein N' family DNA-binding protein n=1 Tax=unclassified Microbacterium TaxID=2609290 RepID=UPI00214BD7FE|nr:MULTISPECIES: primosomal protein N' [unclassified Microbacterium]MCR2811024.1 primosomal protein N' [Microbacterium sp. zg.B185]WIM17722.1 primosomal protein N' [Microbacterium sp. zg-B185]